MRSPLEEAITQRARDFDPQALLALVRARFPTREIRLRSHPSFGLRPTQVEAVDFEPDAVIITLNIGLFSSSSPLPSYFQELFTAPHAGAALTRLVAELDHRLLSDRIEGMGPAKSPRFLPDLQRFREDLLQLAQVGSPATLHRVASHLFPELDVSVTRSPLRRRMPIDDPRLGYAALGGAALGGTALVPVQGLDVILRTEESTTWNGEPWTAEAKRRIDAHLIPLVEGTGIHLVILLVDFEGRARLSLRQDSAFGYEPLERAKAPQITVLFNGPAPRAGASRAAGGGQSFGSLDARVRS